MKLIAKSYRLFPGLYLVVVRELDPPGRRREPIVHARLWWNPRARILAESECAANVIARIKHRYP